MVQVPIKLKAVRGEITSFMIKNFKLTQIPRLKAAKGQITSIYEKNNKQISLAILEERVIG